MNSERVAVIETKMSILDQRFQSYLEAEKENTRLQRALIQEIRNEQAKMKGFWGGIVFVFSAMAVAVGATMNHLLSKG